MLGLQWKGRDYQQRKGQAGVSECLGFVSDDGRLSFWGTGKRHTWASHGANELDRPSAARDQRHSFEIELVSSRQPVALEVPHVMRRITAGHASIARCLCMMVTKGTVAKGRAQGIS